MPYEVLLCNFDNLSIIEGYIQCCCVGKGDCGENNCPDCCAFLEGCLCNSLAVSASRAYVMELYDLSSDPCDYRLIRINNCLQCLSCMCDILSLLDRNFRQLAQ